MIGGEAEETFFAADIYICRWRREVYEGITARISDVYREVGEHAEEVHCFVRIRGAAYKILKYIE